MKRRHLQRCLKAPLGVHTKLIEEVSLTGCQTCERKLQLCNSQAYSFCEIWIQQLALLSILTLGLQATRVVANSSGFWFCWIFFHSDFIHDSKTHQIGSSINLFEFNSYFKTNMYLVSNHPIKDSAQIFCNSFCCLDAKSVKSKFI